MVVTVSSAKHRDHFGGLDSFFCGAECLEKSPDYQARSTHSVSETGLR
jgi:hypothetical protein